MDAKPLKVQVILGSTREGRYGDKPAHWIMGELKEKGIDAELIDLKEWNLPLFDEAASPNYNGGNYTNPLGRKWADKVAEADAYIMIAAEYNHAPTGALKNAIDWVGPEWHKKAVAYVSYGSVGGVRAVEQLRQIAVELQMASVRDAVHIDWATYMATAQMQAPVDATAYAAYKDRADLMIDQLVWWGNALKAARAQQ